MSSLEKKTDLTREGLQKALSKSGNPSFDTVFRVIHAIGPKMELASCLPPLLCLLDRCPIPVRARPLPTVVITCRNS
jgi:hypothetical protein